MHYQGINANMMSLGGIAIAIGGMVDAAIVMIETCTRCRSSGGMIIRARSRAGEYWRLAEKAAVEVGPALFCSLLIITLSFIPVFAGSAGGTRCFSPLAFTKTWSMAVAAGWDHPGAGANGLFFIRGENPG